jgi:hypothetical protein
MLELAVTEHREAEKYVAGTLSGEELARFEEAMIERPELAADVSVRRRIKAGLAQLEQNHELDALLAPKQRRPHYMRYAAAATVLLVVAAGLFTVWNREAVAPLQALLDTSEMGAREVAASFILAKTRSADAPTLDVQRNAGPVQLRILVDDPTAAPFAVRLVAAWKPAGAALSAESSISQITDGFVEIYLDPRQLESGGYTLSLMSKSGVDQLFPFTLNVTP